MEPAAYLASLRDPAIAAALGHRIAGRVASYPAARLPITLMEVCGTHTVSIFRNGIRQILPEGIRLLSGPGCPVCVTPNSEIDRAIAMASQPGIILTTFGDMLRVPGSEASLQEARAAGADVRVVYSPLDAIKLAAAEPTKQIVFFAVGFETTSPAVAGAMLEAKKLGLSNFTIFSAHKVIPPAMKALLESGETKIDGFICPGHVSTIIGARPYEFVARDHHVPCVITGFEPVDILQAIDMLVAQVVDGEAKVEIQYRRTVRWEGNETAVRYLSEVFEPQDAEWRGLGTIPGSGLGLTADYVSFDAAARFPVEVAPAREHRDCLCGVILRGAGEPPDCPLFGTACTPEHPIGPCMVSTEGTCAAWYHYSGRV